ncbi:MAG: hypothetical protein JNM56_33725, partial [Planctomycetia bacterium]|nr:hypothetical protein [Planctomycetia bacterium]
MAWETRHGRGAYYTRTQRLPGGGFRRVYLGTGPAAELAAAQDEERRAQRQAESALRADDRDRWQVGLGAV